jgi:hypothetical protein
MDQGGLLLGIGEVELRDPAAGIHGFGRGGLGLWLRAVGDGKAALLDFDEIDAVAGLEAKLFENVVGEGDATVEGDHCGRHGDPLKDIVSQRPVGKWDGDGGGSRGSMNK